MSDNDNKITSGGWFFPLFIAAKLAGPCAAWSWWWLLAPIVPVLAEIIKYAIKP
jgi:hypothetical protein